MLFKATCAAGAVALTFAAFVPYIRTILSGATQPHVFSWVIWGMTTFVVFFAQLEGRGGVGAWPVGISAGLTIFVALLAFMKRADVSITRTDWLFLISAASSLPLWYLTSDPLWAVIILTTVDVLGFGPTLRKAYEFPHTESVPFFLMFAVRNFLVVMSLEHYSLTTVLFPAVMTAVCVLLMATIAYRRRAAPCEP